MNKLLRFCVAFSLVTAIAGCAGTVIDTTTDAALAVAKTPFKVAGAAVDVLTPDDD